MSPICFALMLEPLIRSVKEMMHEHHFNVTVANECKTGTTAWVTVTCKWRIHMRLIAAQ